MKAVILGNNGVEIKNLKEPSPSSQQILVKVKSCGLNRSDLLETQGQSFGHMGGNDKIIGGEFAGEVVEIGDEVSELKIGDNVMCRGGSGWAEYAVAHSKRSIKFNKDEISWEQAASIQGNMQTMHDAIVTNGNFKIGQSVFVQGASSGVGIMGMQIAKALGASLVLGSSTSQEKLSKLTDYGADVSIDLSQGDWLEKILNATEGKGVDILVDMLSGNFVNKNMEATKINGHLINIGRLAGMNGDFDYDLHAKRRLHYIGTTGRTRTVDENLEVARVANNDLWDYVSMGKIRHVIFKTFLLTEAKNALNLMNNNSHFGKIILLPD